ncbi:MAG: RNA polymerase sigma factor [Bacteroidota bacterium]
MKIKELTDEQLMESFASQNDEVAFGQLYRKYFPMMSKYLGWQLHDPEKGKDLAQNIFLKIYQKSSLFDTSKNFKVWLFIIAKNQMKNELRNEAIRSKHLENIAILPTNENEEKADHTQRLQQLKTELAQLSENHREVFVLKYSNNLTLQEISEICNCSVGTVKSRLFYALQKLKNKLR